MRDMMLLMWYFPWILAPYLCDSALELAQQPSRIDNLSVSPAYRLEKLVKHNSLCAWQIINQRPGSSGELVAWWLGTQLSHSPSTLSGVGHQWTESTSSGCNQWLSLAKIALKVPPTGKNRSMVACTSRCGECITCEGRQPHSALVSCLLNGGLAQYLRDGWISVGWFYKESALKELLMGNIILRIPRKLPKWRKLWSTMESPAMLGHLHKMNNTILNNFSVMWRWTGKLRLRYL
jgi:hypothetical protein